MTLKELIACAKAYQNLGWSVQQQLDDVLGGNVQEHNVHALDLIARWLKTVEHCRGIDVNLQEEIELAREDLEQAFEQAE